MKGTRCLRPTALLLIALMLIYAFPISTHAVPTLEESTALASLAEASSAEPPYLLSDEQAVLSDERAGGIREVTELREENVKHFAMTDGTYTAVSYSTPVHRKDASGVWQDIDNALTLTTVKGNDLYVAGGGRAIFPKSFAANAPLFALTENGYAIAMSLVPDQLSASATVTPIGTVTNAAPRESKTYYDTLEEAAQIDNRSSIVYTNVQANTDLEYILDGNDVKENIIVKSAGTSYIYRFTLALTGLTATLSDAGSISLADSATGETKYVIPAPYMYDASGAVSYDVAYALTGADGTYTLTVTASPDWINAEDRAFPVTIDPTVTATTGFYDTYISSVGAGINHNSALQLPLSSNTIVYVKFPKPTVPTGGIIVAADLYMLPVSVSSGAVTIGAYRMTEEWYATSITWNSASSTMTNFGMSSQLLSSTTISSAASFVPIDIKDAATAWYDGSALNHGIALKYLSGTGTSISLYSDDNTSEYEPYFAVEYILIEEGTYFIQNVATSKYMDVEGPSTASGAAIQQWSFHGGSQSKWELVYVSNYQFRIQSAYSNLYVRYSTSTPTVSQTNLENIYGLWELEKTSSGNYRIICSGASASTNTLSVTASTAGNGSDLTMTSYTDNSDYCDEWILYQCKYTFTVQHYYDQGFNVRFSDENKTALSKIKEYHLNFSERMLKLFGIEVIPQYIYYTSSADSCKISSNGSINFSCLDDACTHSTSHLTSSALRNVVGTGTTTTTVAIWTGHILDNNARSNSIFSYHSVVLTPYATTTENLSGEYINKSDSEVYTQSCYTFTHELSHQLGTHDHYCASSSGSDVPCSNSYCDTCYNGYSTTRTCIMGNRNTGLLANDNIYCDDCIEIIIAHINDHH